MIVPMTQFSLLIFHKDYDAFLGELGKAGVFHVAEINKADDPEQVQRRQQLTDITEAIAFLTSHQPENSAPPPAETRTKTLADILVQVKQWKESEEAALAGGSTEQLKPFAPDFLPTLQEGRALLEDKYAREHLVQHTQQAADGAIFILEGFVPRPEKRKFSEFLESRQIAYLKKRSLYADHPPILLHNNRVSRLFEPIGSLFSLPSYNDLDLTVFFAPFFALFFGFGMNDAGYGLLLFLGASLIKVLHKPKIKRSYLTLVQLLGGITFLFGLITGNIFGLSIARLPGLGLLKNVFLHDKQIFTLAIAIGFVQILFGMVLQGINKMVKFGFRYGLPQLGWIMIILHLLNMFYFKILPLFSHIDIYIGLALIIFFAKPEAGVLKSMGAGIWELFGITGLMGDVLSYIRLFALGVSSAILGLVINDIAWQMEKVRYIGPVLFLIILLFGHGLNLFVASLGAFVHTMRLTFVEFYKNAGFTGGGNPYLPFVITQK